MTFQIRIGSAALKQLEGIDDRRVRALISSRIDALAKEPEKQGKALLGELSGCRSDRAVGQRYRIIYRVEREREVVSVLGLGIRKDRSKADVYSLARKLLRLGLLG